MTIPKAYFLFFAISISMFTSCLTAKKVDKQVAKQYENYLQPQKKKQNDVISVTSSLAKSDGWISTTEAKTSNILPLLVYWSWDYKNTCTLNPQIPINNFTTTVLNAANKGLKQKISGQRLELSVDQIPNKFVILDKAHLVFLIYTFGWDNISIKAEAMDMVVSYKVFKDNVETKKGIMTLPYANDKKDLGMFKSWKKATTEYLEQYDANITSMSKLVVDKLVKEL